MVAFRSRRLSAVVIGTAALVGFTSPASSHAQQAAAPQARIAATVGAATDHFFASGPARLRYRDVGRGDAVILVHGLTRSVEDWIGVGDSLALDHRVIALDLRGFGQSTRFTEPRYFGAEMADDVVRLLDHLRLPRAHMVGHSLVERSPGGPALCGVRLRLICTPTDPNVGLHEGRCSVLLATVALSSLAARNAHHSATPNEREWSGPADVNVSLDR